ncbi:MAG: hypothetical protein HY902_08535 [Deltaproteobacteria bacterium]|nr:hypothetical protein [Deltaproteobacteria bacterium]
MAQLLALAMTAVVAAGALGCSGPALRKPALRLYPPLPNKPRMQFLASFSTAVDVEQNSTVEDFLVGKDPSVAALRKPTCAVIVQDRVLVGDIGAHALVVFDLKTSQFRPMRGDSGEGKVKQPVQMTVADDGTLYVADAGRGQVLAYDQNENFLQAYGTEGQVKPVGVAVHRDSIYVCDRDRHQVVVFDRRTSLVMKRIGAEGTEPGKLYIPTAVAVGPDGDLYVAETGNFRVQRLRQDGTSVRVYGGLGDTPGTFTRPRGVAVDPAGRLFVVDAAFENVQVFDPEGRLLMFFGGPGNVPGELVLPAGIDISRTSLDHFGRIADPRLKLEYLVSVVSQYGPNRVSIFGFGDWQGPYQAPPAPAPAKAAPTAPPVDKAPPAADKPAPPPAEKPAPPPADKAAPPPSKGPSAKERKG